MKKLQNNNFPEEYQKGMYETVTNFFENEKNDVFYQYLIKKGFDFEMKGEFENAYKNYYVSLPYSYNNMIYLLIKQNNPNKTKEFFKKNPEEIYFDYVIPKNTKIIKDLKKSIEKTFVCNFCYFTTKFFKILLILILTMLVIEYLKHLLGSKKLYMDFVINQR
jgi:hypothetical protein